MPTYVLKLDNGEKQALHSALSKCSYTGRSAEVIESIIAKLESKNRNLRLDPEEWECLSDTLIDLRRRAFVTSHANPESGQGDPGRHDSIIRKLGRPAGASWRDAARKGQDA